MKKLINTNSFSTAIKSVSILLVALLFSVGAKAGTPGAPTIASVIPASSTSVTVYIIPPTNNGGTAITSYTVTSSPGGFTGTLSGTGPGSATVSGLTAGTAYTFTVTCTNGSVSPASAASLPVTPGSPAPTNVIAYQASATSASVSFTAPLISGGATLNTALASSPYVITPYDVTTSTVGTPTAAFLSIPGTVTGLTTGHTYTFTVTAVNTTPITSSASIASIPLTLVAAPATNNYTGATLGDWNTPGNWSLGTVPTASSNVTIPTGISVIISNTTTAIANSIALAASASLTNNGTLIVNTVTTGVSGIALTSATFDNEGILNITSANASSISFAGSAANTFTANGVCNITPGLGFYVFTSTATSTVTINGAGFTMGSFTAPVGYGLLYSNAAATISVGSSTVVTDYIDFMPSGGTWYGININAGGSFTNNGKIADTMPTTPQAKNTYPVYIKSATTAVGFTNSITATFNCYTQGNSTITLGYNGVGTLTLTNAGIINHFGSYFLISPVSLNSVFNNSGTMTLAGGYELMQYTSASGITQQFNNTGTFTGTVSNGSYHAGVFYWGGTPTAPASVGQNITNSGTMTLINASGSNPFLTNITNGVSTGASPTVTGVYPTITNNTGGVINFNSPAATNAFFSYQYAGSANSYSTSTTYGTLGAQIYVNGYVYTVTTVGTTSSAAPTWPTASGASVTCATGGAVFTNATVLPILTNSGGKITGYNVTFPTMLAYTTLVTNTSPLGTIAPSPNGAGTGTITLPTSYALYGTFSPAITSNAAYGILGGTTVNYANATIALNTTYVPTTATLSLNITTATATNTALATNNTGAASGWSAPSTSAGTTTGISISYSGTAFAAPTIGTASATSPTSATVSFTAPTSFGAGSAATLYTVTSSPGGITATGTTPAGIVVTGLTSGIAYTFTVTCTNNATPAGTSAASAASGSVTLVAPIAPTSITATQASATTINVSWTGSSTYGTGGTAWGSYTVTAIPISGSTSVVYSGGTSTSATFTGTAGVAYTFTVTATNNASTPVTTSATTSSTVSLIGIPTIGTATINGATSAAIAFTPITAYGAGATGITTYTATSSPGSITGTSTTSPITVSGLTAGTSYTFTVTATNNASTPVTSLASAASNSIEAGTPSVPTSVAAIATGSTTATITWAVPATPNSLTGYTATVYLAGVAQSSPAPISVASGIYTASFSGLATNTTYTIGVYATNATGNSNVVYSSNITTTKVSTFNGTTNTDWGTASNWSNGVPTATTDATIASNAVIAASTVAVANSITINAGITLSNNGTGSGGLTVNTSTIAPGITLIDATFNNNVGCNLSVTTAASNCIAFSGSAGGSSNNNFLANGNISFSATAPTSATSTEYYALSAIGTDSSTVSGSGFTIGTTGAGGVGYGLITSAVATKLTIASGTTIKDYFAFTPTATYNVINLSTASQTLYNKGVIDIYQPATITGPTIYPFYVNANNSSTITFNNSGTYYDTTIGNWQGISVVGGGTFNLINSNGFSSVFPQTTGNAITVANTNIAITNSGTLAVRAYFGFNLQANSSYSQTIVNSGTITSYSSSHGAFDWTSTSASATQTVTNTGTITIGTGAANIANGGFQTQNGTYNVPTINNNTGGVINIPYYSNSTNAFILSSGSVYAQIVNNGGLLEGNFTVPNAACLSTNTGTLGTLSPTALNGTGVGTITLPTSYALYGIFAPVFTSATAYGTIAGTTLALGNASFAPIVPSAIPSTTATTVVTSASPSGSAFLSTDFTNAPGCGVSYSTSWGVTFSAAAPGAPTIGTATAGNAQANVTFTPPTNLGRGTGAITYNVIPYDVTTSTTGTSTSGTTSPIISDNGGTGLNNGDTYTFTVTATVPTGGTSSQSNPSNSVVPAAITPTAPTGVIVSAGDTKALVSFTASSSFGIGATSVTYTITPYIGATAQTSLAQTVSGSPYQFTGLTNGTTYTFSIIATNNASTPQQSAATVSSSVTPSNTITWTDLAGDGLWVTGSNWSGGSVPTSTEDVTIGNYTVTIGSSATAVANTVTLTTSGGSIANSGSLTISGATGSTTHSLNLVTGTTVTNSGTLSITATVSGKSGVAMVGGTFTSTGSGLTVNTSSAASVCFLLSGTNSLNLSCTNTTPFTAGTNSYVMSLSSGTTTLGGSGFTVGTSASGVAYGLFYDGGGATLTINSSVTLNSVYNFLAATYVTNMYVTGNSTVFNNYGTISITPASSGNTGSCYAFALNASNSQTITFNNYGTYSYSGNYQAMRLGTTGTIVYNTEGSIVVNNKSTGILNLNAAGGTATPIAGTAEVNINFTNDGTINLGNSSSGTQNVIQSNNYPNFTATQSITNSSTGVINVYGGAFDLTYLPAVGGTAPSFTNNGTINFMYNSATNFIYTTGAYSTTTTYAVGALVGSGGYQYVCTTAGTAPCTTTPSWSSAITPGSTVTCATGGAVFTNIALGVLTNNGTLSGYNASFLATTLTTSSTSVLSPKFNGSANGTITLPASYALNGTYSPITNGTYYGKVAGTTLNFTGANLGLTLASGYVAPTGGSELTSITSVAPAGDFSSPSNISLPSGWTVDSSNLSGNGYSLKYYSSPTAPTITSLSAGDGSVTVNFNASSSTGGGVTYQAFSTTGGFSSTPSTALSQTVSGLTNGTAYSFYVVATNPAGSATSATYGPTTPNNLPPGAPTIGTATAGDGSALISFSAPSTLGSGATSITTYTVTSSPDGITNTGSTSPIQLTGLTNGTAYTFTVTATNNTGYTGVASGASNSVTPSIAVYWTGNAGDGLWGSGGNWSGGSVPLSTDNVTIGNYAVTISSGTAHANTVTLSTAGGSLTNNATLTINTSTASTPSLTLTDATFTNGSSATLNVTTLSSNCVSISGSAGSGKSNTFTANGTLNFVSTAANNYVFSSTGTDAVTINGTGFTLGSSGTGVSTGVLISSGAATVTIGSSGSLNGTVITDYYVFTAATGYGIYVKAGTLNNYGNVTVTQAGTSSVANYPVYLYSQGPSLPIAFNNYGTFTSTATSGSNPTGIDLIASGTTGGTINVTNSGTIAIAATYGISINTGFNSTITNSGTMSLTNAYDAINYNSNSAVTQQFNNSGTLTLSTNNASTNSNNILWSGTPGTAQNLTNTGTITLTSTTTSGYIKSGTTSGTAPSITNNTSGVINFNYTSATTAFTSGGYNYPILTNSGGTVAGYNTTFPSGTFVSSTGTLAPQYTATGSSTITLPASYSLTGTLAPQILSATHYGQLVAASLITTSTTLVLSPSYTPSTSTPTVFNIINYTAAAPSPSFHTPVPSLPWLVGNSGNYITATYATVPGVPTAVSAADDNAQAEVTFTPPASTGGFAIQTYKVYAYPNGSGTASVTQSFSASGLTLVSGHYTVTVSPLVNGTPYTFAVSANNYLNSTTGIGEGSLSSPLSNAVTPSSTTTWNGTSWSATAPDASQSAIIAGNLNNSNPVGTFSTCANLTINAGVTFTMNSNVTVNGSFTNNGTITGTGTLTLAGGSAQTVSGTGIVGNLTINNSNGVTVTSGSNSFGISGVLTLQSGTLTTNGNVTMKSLSISNSGVVAPIGASGNSGTISGNVTVERFIPSKWRSLRDLCAAGVYASGNTLYNTWQESGSYSQSGHGLFITGATSTAGSSYSSNHVDNGSGGTYLDYSLNSYPSAYYWSTATQTWDTIKNTNTTALNPYQSYRILVRGDRGFDLYTTPILHYPNGERMYDSTALRTTGSLIYGNVTYSSTGVTNGVTGSAYTSSTYGLSSAAFGYSYIANPYDCPIDFHNIYSNGRIANMIYGYWYLDPTVGETGGYVAYNAVANVTNTGYSNGNFIQAGQGFLVANYHVDGTHLPSIQITEADKSIASSSRTSVFGVETPTSKLFVGLLKGSTRVDGVAVVFGNNFSNGIGLEDSRKLSGGIDNISIKEGSDYLSIDGRLPATSSDVLGIYMGKPSTTSYQLRVDASGYINEGYAPLLYDAYKNTTRALSGVDTISFTTDANTASYANRFSIIFSPSALAINSIVASATLNNKIATITWNTVGEKGESRFEVEKSTDGKNFASIGQQAAKNTATASYTATDNDVVATTSYYRIKAVSTTGAVNYSNVAKLTNNSPLTTYSLYPNPLVGKTLNVALNNVASGKYVVSIYNVLGEKVAEQAIAHAGGSATHALTINNTLARGIYSVTIREASSNQIVHQTSLSVQP